MRQQALQNQETVPEMTINMHVKVGFPNFPDLDSQGCLYYFSAFI